jgi:carbonic anhydrase
MPVTTFRRLRAPLLGTALALAALGAHAARWLPITESSVRAVYLDTAGAVREGGFVRTWVREVYTSEQRAEQIGVMYYAANTLMSYDCARRMSAALFRVFYGSDGTELRRVALDQVDVPALASPGSLQEALLERACTPPGKAQKEPGAEGLVKVAASEGAPKPAPAKEPGESRAEKPVEVKAADAKPEGEAAKPQATAAEKPKAAGSETPKAEAPPKQAEQHAAAPGPKPEAQETHGKPAEAHKPIKLPVTRETARHTPPNAARYALYEPPRRAKTARAEPGRRPPGPAPKDEETHEVHWSYTGPSGPEHWGKLKPEFAACASGKRQSPIDIRDGARLELEPIKFEYQPGPLRIVDNGHTVQVNYAAGSSIQVAGERYELKQFHFHKPSEERVNGRLYDMVAHLVHQSMDGRLAVVAVLFEAGPFQNAFVRALWPHLPLEAGREIAPLEVKIDVNELLPAERTYYTFMGSLTTPPCSEGVLWLVLKNPVPITAEQVGVFGRLYALNARPVQPPHGRLIKESM